jgi:hypothetical protein
MSHLAGEDSFLIGTLDLEAGEAGGSDECCGRDHDK